MTPVAYLAQHAERHLEELVDFLRLPSVSAQPEHRDDTRRAAEWLAAKMSEAGLETAEVLPTGGHPVVVGEWRRAQDAPTVLVYGHYDVQPPEPLELWTSPPFEPEIRDGQLFARGAVDDKGQLYLHLKAVEAHLRTRGSLSANVIFVVEGEEETGSAHLDDFLERHQERLRCDAVLISDTSMFAPGLPSITVGLRGIAYFEVRLRGPDSDLHSGSYGGAVANPANALARVLAGLHHGDGRIAIPGFYDRVRPLTAEERDEMRALPFSEQAFCAQVGAPALAGEEGFSTLERLWARPALDVNGLLSGYTGEGSKTVLPAEAMAKVSARLVPDQDPGEICQLFEKCVRQLAPAGVEVEVELLHHGHPWLADPGEAVFDAAAGALREAFGHEPVFIREGGSIPIVHALRERFGVPIVLMGFGLPGENAHAPDEWMSLENFHRGAEAVARFYDHYPTKL
ncbi:MAG: dipeptidase [Longimicrobiaceae bacterium]